MDLPPTPDAARPAGTLPQSTCPFCRSRRLVTGSFLVDYGTGDASIELVGVSISFWKAEFTRQVNAVKVGKQATLCLACGMAWAKADERRAVELIERFGSEALKRIAPEDGPTETPPQGRAQ